MNRFCRRPDRQLLTRAASINRRGVKSHKRLALAIILLTFREMLEDGVLKTLT